MIFITGMVRSGTTHAAQLVAEYTRTRIAPQPMPLLYPEVMRAFHAQAGRDRGRYPLTDCVFDNAYDQSALESFLDAWKVDAAMPSRLLQQQAGYSGWQTQVEWLPDAPEPPAEGGFDRSLRWLFENLCAEGVRSLDGAKETTAEEFAPYLSARGWFIVLVVRDIRDVLTSMNYGRGQTHTGLPKPTLFNIRQWRKSVAIALHTSERPNVLCIRHEDLIGNPHRESKRIQAAFQTWAESSGFRHVQRRARSLESLPVNTSFDDSGPGERRFSDLLDRAVLNFTEALCWRELQLLGYEREQEPAPALPEPGAFADPFVGKRPELDDYAWNEQRWIEETERERMLLDPTCHPDNASAFIYPTVRHILSGANV